MDVEANDKRNKLENEIREWKWKKEVEDRNRQAWKENGQREVGVSVKDEDWGVRGGESRMEVGEDGGGVHGWGSLKYKRSERKYVGEKSASLVCSSSYYQLYF